MSAIEIGRTVRYFLGINDEPRGVIVAIHGVPGEHRDTVSGAITFCNPAACRFDIVTIDGRRFSDIRESRIDKPGIGRVTLCEGVVGPCGISDLEHAVVVRKTEDATKKAIRQQLHADEVAQLIIDNPTLVPCTRHSGGVNAAANLRKMLKAAGIKTASLRSDYNSLRLVLPADAADEALDTARELAHRFVSGSFDGMTDCFEYQAYHAWGDAFGSVKYAFVDRQRGDA